MICKNCGRELLEGEVFCGECGTKVEAFVPVETFTPVEQVSYVPYVQKTKNKTPVGWIIALAVLCVVIAVVGVFGYRTWNDLQEKEALVEEQETLIEEQEAKIEQMQGKCDNYDIICSLNNANIGYISNEFRVTKGTVVLSKDDMGKQITLTTDWWDGATISTSYEGTSAELDFDNNSWYEKTTMTIVPHHEGVTIVTFSNDLNSESFKVLLIVTE